MQSKMRSLPEGQRVRLLLTSTLHKIIYRPRSLSQPRRFLLLSQSLSDSLLGIRFAYAFTRASHWALEFARA